MKKQTTLFVMIILLLASNAMSQTVYVTKSGKKYHTENCRYLSKNTVAVDLSDAVNKGFTECSVCKPPTTNSSYSIDSETESTSEGKDNQNTIESTNDANQKVQCSAMTKAKKRCKRMTKSPNGKCWQHGGD